MGTAKVTQFLTHLAVTEHVATATQNQALNVIIFLYRTVLTPDEVQRVISHLYGVHQLVVQLLYGSGLRLSGGLELRVKDADFAQQQLVIRETKDKASRVTMLPTRVIKPLQVHLQAVRRVHQQDLDGV